jgi:hypothetical protein
VVETYRSYVIRVRRRGDLDDSVRLDVEDLLGGRRAALNGDEARTLADRLTDMVGGAARPPTDEVASPDPAPEPARRRDREPFRPSA